MRSCSSTWKCPSVGSGESRAVTRRAVATSAAASFQTVSPSDHVEVRVDQHVGERLRVGHDLRPGADREQRVEAGRARAGGVDREHLAECWRASGPQTDASSPLKSRTSADSVQVRSVGTMLLTPLPVRVGPSDEPVHVAGREEGPPAVEPDDDARPAVAERAERPEVARRAEARAGRPLLDRQRLPHLAQPEGRRGQEPDDRVEREAGEEAGAVGRRQAPGPGPPQDRERVVDVPPEGRPSAGSKREVEGDARAGGEQGQRQAGQEREAVEAGRRIASPLGPPTASAARPAAPPTASRPGR